MGTSARTAMKTKLTLRLDEEAIRRAKAYAAERDSSVSRLVEDYFRLLDSPISAGDEWKEALGPRVRSLLERPPPAVEVSEDDYRRHLEGKHG